jgi:uncharacterized RDD family membrane protein YckC
MVRELDMTVPPLNAAGFRARLSAFALDYIVMFIYIAVLTAVGFILTRLAPALVGRAFGKHWSSQLIVIVVLTLPITLYFALFESSTKQATLGKRRMGLVVTDREGRRLNLTRSLARSLLKFVPWELAHTCIWGVRFAVDPAHVPLWDVGLAVVWLLVGANLVALWLSNSKQTLYDRLSGSVVRMRAA